MILLTTPERIRTEEARENWQALAGTKAELHVADETAASGRGLEHHRGGRRDSRRHVRDWGEGRGREGALRDGNIDGERSRGVKVAVDLPSGIDPATGAASRPSVRADVTVALHLPKVGLKGREEFTGEVVVVPIGIRGTTRGVREGGAR